MKGRVKQRFVGLFSMSINFLIFFGILLLSDVLGLIIRGQIMQEVNQHLPQNEQFSWSTWPPWRSAWVHGDKFRLWRTHQQFFPTSMLRMCYATVLVLAVVWMLFGLSLLA